MVCGSRKFQVDALGDHLCTCTDRSGVKKAHDWVVDQLPDLFHTTHKVKTQQVVIYDCRCDERLKPKHNRWLYMIVGVMKD